MILPLIGLLIGALVGIFMAKRRGGKRLDMLQWAGVIGIMGTILGIFVLVVIERMAM